MNPEFSEERGDITEIAKDVLEVLLGRMGIVATVVPQAESLVQGEEEAPVPVTLDI